jgi:hypothetical protein
MKDIAALILKFVRTLKTEASKAPKSKYRDGYVDALNQVDEHILSEGWKEGWYNDEDFADDEYEDNPWD